jgi:undecaprenyl diphosphate synthase
MNINNTLSLNHLAIITDGNRRWGEKNKLSIKEAYQTGAENVKTIIKAAIEKKIKNLTLYGLSKENFSRPKIEIEILLAIFSRYIENEIENLNKNGIKLKIIGNFTRISSSIQEKIKYAEAQTKDNNVMNLYIAFSYSGKEEIVDAVKKYSRANNIDNLTEESLSKYMYSDIPPVDLLVRTGGDMRISNFLLWHINYAELYFTDKLWPEFNSEELAIAINKYYLTKRSFGV